MPVLTALLILAHFIIAVVWRRTYHDACQNVEDNVLATIILELSAAIVCFLLVPLFPWQNISWALGGKMLGVIALLTLAESVGNVLQTRAIGSLSPGASGLLSPVERLVVCLAGGVLFDNNLTWEMMAGATLVFGGLFLLARSTFTANKLTTLALGALAYAIFGATSLADSRFMWDINPALYLGCGFVCSSLYLGIYRRPSPAAIRQTAEAMTLKNIGLVALVWGPGSLTALMAYQSGYVLVAPILALSPILNAIVGWVKGDKDPPSVLATACVGLGILLLIFKF